MVFIKEHLWAMYAMVLARESSVSYELIKPIPQTISDFIGGLYTH